MLSALICSAHSYPAMPLVRQLVHQRCVHSGPLVLRIDPLKFPNVHSGYKPNCLTRVIPSLLMARTISSSFFTYRKVRSRRIIGCKLQILSHLYKFIQNQSLRGQKSSASDDLVFPRYYPSNRSINSSSRVSPILVEFSVVWCDVHQHITTSQ